MSDITHSEEVLGEPLGVDGVHGGGYLEGRREGPQELGDHAHVLRFQYLQHVAQVLLLGRLLHQQLVVQIC